eukprot:195187-Prymnesium_polylepis.1
MAAGAAPRSDLVVAAAAPPPPSMQAMALDATTLARMAAAAGRDAARLQARGALRRPESPPGLKALATIEHAGREALASIRRAEAAAARAEAVEAARAAAAGPTY